MNETIKITEQELKQLIKEELGIHNDVNNLSDYIINYIKDKHYDIYTFTENQLPKLNKVKIDKIIVNYTNKENVSYFDIKKSQIRKYDFLVKAVDHKIFKNIKHDYQILKYYNVK